MSKSTFIIGRLQTACAVECPLPGIRVAGGEVKKVHIFSTNPILGNQHLKDN